MCQGHGCVPFEQVHERNFYSCPNCSLIFVDRSQLLSAAEEYERYLLHENSSDDPAYRSFLKRLTDPLSERLQPNSKGLDFGCGPGPTVAMLLAEQGHIVKNYDPYFANDPELLKEQYDFITATEVLEHLREPVEVLQQLDKMLRPGGWLALMTQFFHESIKFESWHYPRDPTHINFFSEASMCWIATNFDYVIDFIDRSVVLLRKA